MVNRIIHHREQNRVIHQLMCVECLEPYNETFGFKKFTIGMSKKINREI